MEPQEPPKKEPKVILCSSSKDKWYTDRTLDQGDKLMANTQDFGIEKHGFRLPPPFYPSHPPTIFSPAEPPSLSELANSQLPLPSTARDEEGGETAEAVASNLSSPLPPKTPSPDFHPRSTPLDDPGPSSPQSSYQGYGHVQYPPFCPQPTPPTEASTSPAHCTHQGHGHTQSNSFYPESSSPLNGITSPTQSSYQGYTYNNPYPNYQVLYPPNYDFQQQISTSVPFENDYGSAMPYYSQAPAFSTMGSHPPLTPSATPLNSATIKSPDDLKHYQSSTNDSASTPSTVPNNLESPGRAASESTLGFEDASSFSTVPKSNALIATVGRDPEIDVWHTTILESLRHVPLGALSDQLSVSNHLLQHFNSGSSYADCCLQVTHKSQRFQKTEFWLHSLLVAQSPTLQALLNNSEAGSNGKRILCLEVHDRYATPVAIGSALRVCYGDSPFLFTGSAARTERSQSAAAISVSWMENVLAYAAAGRVLQLQPIVTRGMQIASAIMHWDNLEAALSFTLDPGLDRIGDLNSPFFPQKEPVTEITSPHIKSDSKLNVGAPQTSINASTDLLYKCLHFILANFPRSWNLDASARPLADNDRLPMIAEKRSPVSKSRLSRIQFGDYPSEIDAKSNDPNTILSSIILSLPFTLLKYLWDRFEEPVIRRNGRLITLEREQRRLRVLKVHSASFIQKQAAADIWAEAGWEEFVVEADDSNPVFTRKWVGF